MRCADPRCILCGSGYSSYHGIGSRLLDNDDHDIERLLDEHRNQRKQTAYEKKVAGLDKVDGAVRMFRTWELTNDGRLEAMVNTYKWSPGQNSADMSSDRNAGFYGFWTLGELKRQEPQWWERSQSGAGYRDQDAWMYYTMTGGRYRDRPKDKFYVCGTVLGHGHLKVGEFGGKVQYAIPEYVIEPEGCDPDFGLRVLNVAEKYGMKIISVKQARRLKGGPVKWWKGKPIE